MPARCDTTGLATLGLTRWVMTPPPVIFLDYPPSEWANATAHRIADRSLFWQAWRQQPGQKFAHLKRTSATSGEDQP
jgi:hypothetical protein